MTCKTAEEAIRSLLAAKAAEIDGKLRNPTPEHAEYQRKAREALHELVGDVCTHIYIVDGEGVFDGETITMLYKLAYSLHDVIDGNPIGTFTQRANEQLREQTKNMKCISPEEFFR